MRVNNIFKISISVFLIIIISFSISGCSKQREKQTTSVEEKNTESQASVENQLAPTKEKILTGEDYTESETVSNEKSVTEFKTTSEIFDDFLADKVTLHISDREMLFSEMCIEYDIKYTGFRDVDNDGEAELALISYAYFTPIMFLDVDQGKLVILSRGDGVTGYLFATVVDDETWLCHSDTTHMGEYLYHFVKYEGYEKVSDEFDLNAVYDNTGDDKTLICTYRGQKVTLEEFKTLVKKYTENAITYFNIVENVIDEMYDFADQENTSNHASFTEPEHVTQEQIFSDFLDNKIALQYYDSDILFSELCQKIYDNNDLEGIKFLDVNNDNVEELIISSYAFYHMIILDVVQDKLVVLACGGGTGQYLNYIVVDEEIWLYYSHLSSNGEDYYFTKYEGYGNIVDEFHLSAWENEDKTYNCTYRDKSITIEEYEDLKQKYLENSSKYGSLDNWRHVGITYIETN